MRKKKDTQSPSSAKKELSQDTVVALETTKPVMHFEQQIQDLQGLFLISTPIGHLEDISLRALTALKHVDFLLCEDTRQTQFLLNAYDIRKECLSFHQHNQEKKLPMVLKSLQEGKKIGLVSDRGTPMISDPGDILIHACFKAKIPVHFLPGPCAAIMAVVLSGFACQRFCFEGFLPLKKTKEHLEFLKNESRTIIFFEAPHRIQKTLCLLLEVWGDRKVCLLREMTKKFEERIEGTVSSLIKHLQEPRGEMVLVVEGADTPSALLDLTKLKELLKEKQHLPLRRHDLKQLAKEWGCSSQILYREWIALKDAPSA